MPDNRHTIDAICAAVAKLEAAPNLEAEHAAAAGPRSCCQESWKRRLCPNRVARWVFCSLMRIRRRPKHSK